MANDWWNDDDQFLATLEDAIRAAQAIPHDYVETGKAAYTWRNIDAELAALTYDSALDEERAPAISRADPASLRALSFASAELEIELEVTADAILGLIAPPQPGELGVRVAKGQLVTAAIDEVGCFVIRPIPSEPFQLHCHTAEGANVSTDWIRL